MTFPVLWFCTRTGEISIGCMLERVRCFLNFIWSTVTECQPIKLMWSHLQTRNLAIELSSAIHTKSQRASMLLDIIDSMFQTPTPYWLEGLVSAALYARKLTPVQLKGRTVLFAKDCSWTFEPIRLIALTLRVKMSCCCRKASPSVKFQPSFQEVIVACTSKRYTLYCRLLTRHPGRCDW